MLLQLYIRHHMDMLHHMCTQPLMYMQPQFMLMDTLMHIHTLMHTVVSPNSYTIRPYNLAGIRFLIYTENYIFNSSFSTILVITVPTP